LLVGAVAPPPRTQLEQQPQPMNQGSGQIAWPLTVSEPAWRTAEKCNPEIMHCINVNAAHCVHCVYMNALR
jgi:hypothetical protein